MYTRTYIFQKPKEHVKIEIRAFPRDRMHNFRSRQSCFDEFPTS